MRPLALLKSFLIVATLALLGYVAQAYLGTHRELTQFVPFYPAPCSAPLTYDVARFDEGFGISRADFLDALAEAADLWNTAAGKDVFARAEGSARVPVNLIYNERQRTVQLGKTLERDESRFGAERAQIDAIELKFEAAKQDHAARLQTYEARARAYQAAVESANAHGGASGSEYAKLQAEKAALQREQAAINAEADGLAALAAQVNAQVDAYNALVRKTNQKVDAYNENAGSDFNQGIYVEQGTDRHIDIYAFRNHAELVHALAHELGHALGIEHTKDPVSIMYPYNESGIELASEDIVALKAVCRL